HRLVTFIRNPDRRQIAGAQLLRQTERVAPVGLHPVARLLLDQRRRKHNALMTQALDLPIEPIPSRTRLVAERQPLISGGKLLHQLGCRYSGIVDLADKPHLNRTSGLRDRDCIAQLRRIKSDESFGMMVHDSPSLPEALPGLSRSPSQLHRGRVASARKGTYGLRSIRATLASRHASSFSRGMSPPR